MKKSILKILAISLIVASIGGFSAATAFADTTNGSLEPSSAAAAATVKKITVKNVKEPGVTVTAYQLAKGEYNAVTSRIDKYVRCENVPSTFNLENPSADDVAEIANNIGTMGVRSVVLTANGSDYVANVEAGEYLILVTGSDTTVYNPAVVSVNADYTETTPKYIDGEVDFTTKYKEGEVEVYLKSSTPTLDKKVVDSSEDNENGDTVAVGDTIDFEIDTVMLSYSKDYVSELIFEISDNLEPTAFLGVKELKVNVGSNDIVAKDDTYSVVYKDANGNETTNTDNAVSFTVAFKDQFIRDNGTKSVVISYSTKLTEDAGINYAENKNIASLRYSNDPTDKNKSKTIKDKTYHYTFGIDAKIDGEDSGTNTDGTINKEVTHEIVKVGKKDQEKVEVKDGEDIVNYVSTEALEGAEFELSKDNSFASNQIVGTASSDTNGLISFTGLDEGTYFLRETKAPTNYTINDMIYKIVIAADLDEDTGILKQYSVTTYTLDASGTPSAEPVGRATYVNTMSEVHVSEDDADYGDVTNKITYSTKEENIVTTTEIVDTRLATLPATGGAGTIMLTIGASIGMAGFLSLYIVNKKKKRAAAEAE
ncbi:MAG: LPXTG cell wall anchor domain-containing protein [Clostridia bacterium]|nr:LPXTG cell wall anchor domain-containing protein [Clostridia bacterium]